MDTEQLQQFLRDYPDGVTMVFYLKQTTVEAWYRNAQFDDTTPEFVQTTIENLPGQFDYRCMLLHFTKMPLYINKDPYYLEKYEDQTIFLQNDSNQCVQKVALTMWPERKIIIGVGCKYGQEGYLQALNMLKNDKLIREQQLKQRQVKLQVNEQIFNLDIIRAPKQLRRMSQPQIFFWFKDMKDGIDLLPELYQIISQYPQMYFSFTFSQQTKAAIESNLSEFYYLNLINIVECINQDLINLLTVNLSENESKGLYFYIPAWKPAEGSGDASQEQIQGSLFDKETGEKQLVNLILTLERSAEQSSFNKRTTVQEYCQFNMEHEQMLGFHGKCLKYVQRVSGPREAAPGVGRDGTGYDSFCLFEVALEDEKSVEYVRGVLALQKKYAGTYFVVSLRNQFNINAEFLNTIQQKDRSFKELNLVEGFSHTLRAELGEESERNAFVGYVYVKNAEQICSGEVYKEVDKILAQHVQDLDRLKDETPVMLEADCDCVVDEASLTDDGLLFRGYRLAPLNVIQPYVEGKEFCVCYLNRGQGFEKACEIIYRLKELLAARCYFLVIVKGLDEKSQIAELSKRAFYLQRLNVYRYRHGFNKFMEACNKGEFNHQAVFYSSDGQFMPIAIEAGGNSVDILQFSLSTSPQFQDMFRSLVPSQQKQDELLSKKPAQLLQINKPAHNNFVHSGVVFNGQLFSEYNKQKYVLFVFLSEANQERWAEIQAKLVEFQQSKVCNQIMYTLVCGQNVTQANISSQLLEKDSAFRKLNYLYDYAGNCQINADIALCHVWDVHGCECHLFQSIEEVEKEYLEVAISDARKNTNIFTEAAFVEIQQIQYPFALRAGPKAINQQCLFIYLGNYEMATLLPQLQFVLNLQTYFKDFYIVSGVSFQSENQIEELKRVYFYDTEVNVVQVTGDAFTVPYQFNFSDQNGLQQQIGQAKDELLNLIQNKSKYREYAEQKAVQANRSMSVIVDGVQMPYLNKAYDCSYSRFVIAQLSMDDLSSPERLQELDQIQSKNLYLLVATTAQDFRAMNRLLKETPQASIYNIVNDAHKFLESRGRFIYVGEQGEREEFDEFKQLNEAILDKIGKNQTDLSPSDAQTMEVVINDRRIELAITHRSRSRYGQQQLVLTFYEDVASAADLIYEQYVKQQTNSMQYHIAVFPTEKLLKEIGKPDSYFDAKSVLRHYNYINVAVCDQVEMMDFVGHTYVNLNHKYTRVQLSELGKGDMYGFASFEIPVQPTEEALKRLGVFTPYLKKAEDFKEDAAGFVLYPLAHDDGAIATLVELQAKYQDLQFIAQVQDFIKGEPFTQIQRYKCDTKIRLCFGSVMVEQDVIDVEAARTVAERAQPKPLTAVFDYELSKSSRLEPEKMQFQLDGYAFQLIQKVTTYTEGMTIYYLNMNEADLQELLRFAELVTANGIFAFVTVTGVQDVAALEALSARLPMLKTLNVAKYISGMELVPAGRIYHFNDSLHFAGVYDVYHADAFGQNPDIQKLTFDLKFGQKVPQQNEEGYNPSNPTVDENGKIVYKLKGRRYRLHKNKYMNQRQILWANDPNITPEQLRKLDDWMGAGILVIGSFPHVPVFDDENRFQDEQIDHEAKKDLDEGMSEEDKKTIIDEKKKQLEVTRLRADNINIVDFECGPETVGYILMDVSARYQTKLLPFNELEKLMPVVEKPQQTEENTTAAE